MMALREDSWSDLFDEVKAAWEMKSFGIITDEEHRTLIGRIRESVGLPAEIPAQPEQEE